MRQLKWQAFAAALALLAPGAARAAGYSIAPIVKFGDKIGSATILSGVNGAFEIGTLINSGALSFVTENAAGGEILGLYANGKLTAILLGGSAAPSGFWPADVGILSPVNMNQAGTMAFAADLDEGVFSGFGTFTWDPTTQKFNPVISHGMPSVYPLTFERGANWLSAINSSNEVACAATVQNHAGQSLSGDFLLNTNGQLVAIALPDDVLPDGNVVLDACNPSLNDQGVIAFSVRLQNEPTHANNCYMWQNGVRSAVALVGTTLPGNLPTTFTVPLVNVVGNWVNNQNGNILLAVQTNPIVPPGSIESPVSLYLWSKVMNKVVFTPVAVPGQTMPDGSKLVSVQDFGVSFANDLGQHAFLAILQGGATAAYLMNADGSLALIMKSGTTTSLGTISDVGQGAGTSSGIGLNKSGQVTFTARIGTSVDTIVLLTPTP